jgi:hypothetical protein
MHGQRPYKRIYHVWAIRVLGLFASSRLMWFSKTHPGAAAVLVDEFDVRDDLKRGPTRLTDSRLKHVHRYDALTDAQQSAMPVP